MQMSDLIYQPHPQAHSQLFNVAHFLACNVGMGLGIKCVMYVHNNEYFVVNF